MVEVAGDEYNYLPIRLLMSQGFNRYFGIFHKSYHIEGMEYVAGYLALLVSPLRLMVQSLFFYLTGQN